MRVLMINNPCDARGCLLDLIENNNISHSFYSDLDEFYHSIKSISEPFVLISEILTTLDIERHKLYEILHLGYLKGILLISQYEEDIIHSTKCILHELNIHNVHSISHPLDKHAFARTFNKLLSDVEYGPHTAPPGPTKKLARPIGQADTEHLVPFFQPKVCSQSECIVGYEVLSRLRIDGQVLTPDTFLPDIIKAGHITRFTYFLVEKTLSQFTDMGKTGFSLSFNVDYHSLNEPDFADKLLRIIHRFGFPFEQIGIEITENASLINTTVIGNLTKFRIKGCRVAIDDFGMNQCGFTELLKLPFSEIKIDRSYVRDIERSNRAYTLVQALSAVASHLGDIIVAEGVETAEQRDLLRELDIDLLQGFLYGKPESLENL